MIATLFKIVYFLFKIPQLLPSLLLQVSLPGSLKLFFPVVGMTSPNNAGKAKLESGEIQRIRKWEIKKSIQIPESQNKSDPDGEGGGLDLF